MENESVLEMIFYGNTVKQYLIAFGWFVGGSFLLLVIEKFVISKIKSLADATDWHLDDVIISIAERSILPVLYLGSFYVATTQLTVDEEVRKMITFFCVIILTVQIARFILSVMLFFINKGWMRKEERGEATMASKTMNTVVQIVVWGIATIFILDNLGFDISAIVAGLGIGGVAVAFAAQAILGDLFNYFVIFFDKPFEEGDFIIIGDYLGTIEHIGIKTTRVRSLGGEQIVFSNSDLCSSRVRNYKRMQQRRVVFSLGVTYQTPKAKMERIPEMIHEIIKGVDRTVFDRAHFQNYGDFSMNFEVVYFVLSSDYNIYMDIQQDINLRILEAFEKEGIEFAYPTQTLFVNKEN